MNKNANLAVSIAAGLLISGAAFEAMADGSSRSGSVRVATWNAAGVSDAAAATVYVDGIGASWFGVANCGVDGVFTAFDGGAVGAGADATGAYWASGISPDVTNDIAFTTASVDRRYHVHHVTLAGASTAVVQVQLDTSTPSYVTNQLNQIIADFEHTKRVVVMGEMSEHFEAFELLRAAGFVLANDDSTVGTTSSGASVANIAARGFVISDFAAHTTSLGSSYAISCTLTPGADYDSRVEYIEAPNDSGVSYINTGLYPADDMGVLLRFSPLRTEDSTVCGVQSYSTSYKTNFKWYFGVGNVAVSGRTTHRAYLSWDTSNPSPATRPIVAVGSVYDAYFNYKNDRNRRLLGVDNTTDYSLAIEKTWPSDTTSNTIYLFAYNNNGSAIGNTGNVRMYSAAFTKGTESVMDLVPVRKDGVGYFYNKIDGTLVGKTGTSSTPAYTWGGDLDSTIGGYIKLDDDADWTSSGKIAVDTATVIDLNGHSLTVSELSGYGMITDTSTGTPGELHIAVADGDDVVSSVELTGNLKLVKEGAGSLAMTRKWQTFTGGVLVSEGTAYSPASGSTSTTYAEGYNYWGPSGATITVSADATFDTKGNYQFDNKNFVLAGGTLANTGSDMNKSDWHGIGNVTLTADSTLDPQKNTRFTALGSPAEVIDLGGHTLTVSLAYRTHLYAPLSITNGTLDFISGGYLNVESGTSGGSQTLDLKMNGAAFHLHGDFAVRDYHAAYTNRYNHGAESLKVYGTFTPAAVDEEGRECFHGCVLQDGATIDLSSKTGVFDTTATGWPVAGHESDADGAQIVTFADGATVTVDLVGRTLTTGERIIAWDSAPENVTFVLDAATAEGGKTLASAENGLYYGVSPDMPLHSHWTGAAGDGDISNVQNWASTNILGTAIEAVPCSDTAVHISGDVYMQIPASSPLAFDSLEIDNVRLVGDRDFDWRGLSGFMASDVVEAVDWGTIDLNGHVLQLDVPEDRETLYNAVSWTFTDTSAGDPGELHVSVGTNTSCVCDRTTLTGNLKLVKEGPGWLAMTKGEQSFTGGVLVTEGTAYSLDSEADNRWGPSGATITVAAGATFDTKGNAGFGNKNFVLAGGTLANTGKKMSADGIGNVTLTADSTLNPQYNTVFAATGDPAKSIDLGGHTLYISLMFGARLVLPLAIVNGTLDFISGGYLELKSGTSGGSQTVDLRMNGAAFDLNGDFAVRDYYAAYTNRYNHGAASLKVYGTFTPAAVDGDGKEYFHGCVMQNGSTIDISTKTNTWNLTASGWPVSGYESDADGAQTVTFADNATVNIDIGGRSVSSVVPLVSWSTAPTNLDTLTFRCVNSTGAQISIKKKDDGLYAWQGMVLLVR